MIPGMGGLNPKKMQSMMKQLGIKQDVIEDAQRVTIERENGTIVIDNPQVTKIEMQGQETWQILGDAREETGISDADIQLVAEKTGKTPEEARNALEQVNGEVAEAIIALSE